MQRPELRTSLETEGSDARFVVRCQEPTAQAELEHLGYGRVGDGAFATPWFARSADTESMFGRFSAAIGPMVEQSADRMPVPWEHALETFLERVEGSGLVWWVYGSSALTVRGLDVRPGDVDVNVDDPQLAGRLFGDLLVTPVLELHGWVARYAGRAFDGAVIEWLSEPRPELDDPACPNEQGPFGRELDRDR